MNLAKYAERDSGRDRREGRKWTDCSVSISRAELSGDSSIILKEQRWDDQDPGPAKTQVPHKI